MWLPFNALTWPGFNSHSIQGWVQAQARGNNAALFAAVLWSLWRCWNEIVMGVNRWTMVYVCEGIRRELLDYASCLGSPEPHQFSLRNQARLSLPSSSCVPLMTDGAYISTRNCMGIGGVLRDYSGDQLGVFYAGIPRGDALLAEIKVLSVRLLMTWRRKFSTACLWAGFLGVGGHIEAELI